MLISISIICNKPLQLINHRKKILYKNELSKIKSNRHWYKFTMLNLLNTISLCCHICYHQYKGQDTMSKNVLVTVTNYTILIIKLLTSLLTYLHLQNHTLTLPSNISLFSITPLSTYLDYILALSTGYSNTHIHTYIRTWYTTNKPTWEVSPTRAYCLAKTV